MLNTFHFLNASLLAKLEVGEHYYWKIGGLSLHGQVFITSWVVWRCSDWCCFPGVS